MAVLYFEPTIYIPYDVSLRKRDAVKLVSMEIEGGDTIDVGRFDPRPKRFPNRAFVYMQFNKPLHMDVTEIQGTGGAVAFRMHYHVQLDGKTISVRHRQHVAVTEVAGVSRFIKHFTTRHAFPAVFGLVGQKRLEEGWFKSGVSLHRELLQFGLDGEDHEYRKWAIETVDILTPSAQVQHGTLQ
jgi:hypothetical protein